MFSVGETCRHSVTSAVKERIKELSDTRKQPKNLPGELNNFFNELNTQRKNTSYFFGLERTWQENNSINSLIMFMYECFDPQRISEYAFNFFSKLF